MKVAADPEQVDGTILDGRDYSSGQLPQENIRIIKEADATLRLNLGTQLDALYDRPHKEITNEGGTLIIIHDADSWPIGTFVVLITVARPCGSRRVGLSFLSRGK
ncbi:hypothetical protein [Bifidobacterium longum]|uniref:hypothetical protein n=2 Tax=Bifidobacterium TaxID=1678 RepID=UPI001F61050E|nr:hypothetical protein [Bifidobacterium longum]